MRATVHRQQKFNNAPAARQKYITCHIDQIIDSSVTFKKEVMMPLYEKKKLKEMGVAWWD